MAVAAFALATGNVKAGTLLADLDRETAEQEVCTQEINRASEAYSNHQSNWLALTKLAVHHQLALIHKERLLIARARAQYRGYPQAPVHRAEQRIDKLEADVNRAIAVLAQQGISVY